MNQHKNKQRHGEYKVPGGKLVIIDLELEKGMLEHVLLSGDFFLEPPEALDAITQALVGASEEASEEELAARIRAHLSHDVEMVGFSPEAVAIAVKRALA